MNTYNLTEIELQQMNFAKWCNKVGANLSPDGMWVYEADLLQFTSMEEDETWEDGSKELPQYTDEQIFQHYLKASGAKKEDIPDHIVDVNKMIEVQPVMKNIPEKIYLQVGDDDLFDADGDFKELSEVSWCHDRIYDTDIEYVRSKGEPVIDNLRDKFANAHWHGWFARERYDGPDRHGYENILPANWGDMDYEEKEEWFFEQWWNKNKPYLKSNSEPVIDWEGLRDDFYNASENYVDARKTFNWLKSNLPNYITSLQSERED